MSYTNLIYKLNENRNKKRKEKRVDSSIEVLQGLNNVVIGYNDYPKTEKNILVEPNELFNKTETCKLTFLDQELDDLAWEFPERILTYITRELNILDSNNDVKNRRSSANKLAKTIIDHQDKITTYLSNKILQNSTSILLKTLSDPIESVRETMSKIVYICLFNATDISSIYGYILPILLDRFGGNKYNSLLITDEEHQLPEEIVSEETSDEIRIILMKIIQLLIERSTHETILHYINNFALLLIHTCMDTDKECKLFGCELITLFLSLYRKELFHFSLPFARSVSSCLTHNHAIVRSTALDVLTETMITGEHKYATLIVEHLSGHYDNNSVPIKAFFDHHMRMNYLAKLNTDRSESVREKLTEVLCYWLIELEDRLEYEGVIAPYILTSFFDQSESIQYKAVLLLERASKQYAFHKQKELQAFKNYNIDQLWTYNSRGRVPVNLSANFYYPEWNGVLAISENLSKNQYSLSNWISLNKPHQNLVQNKFIQLENNIENDLKLIINKQIEMINEHEYSANEIRTTISSLFNKSLLVCPMELSDGKSIADKTLISNVYNYGINSLYCQKLFTEITPEETLLLYKVVTLSTKTLENQTDTNWLSSFNAIAGRPSLEARMFVQSFVRRFINALLKDIKCEFMNITYINAANLLSVLISYLEENIAEYVDKIFILCIKVLSIEKITDKNVRTLFSNILRSIGTYCQPNIWWENLRKIIAGDFDEKSKWTGVFMLSRILSGASSIIRDINDQKIWYCKIKDMEKKILSTIDSDITEYKSCVHFDFSEINGVLKNILPDICDLLFKISSELINTTPNAPVWLLTAVLQLLDPTISDNLNEDEFKKLTIMTICCCSKISMTEKEENVTSKKDKEILRVLGANSNETTNISLLFSNEDCLNILKQILIIYNKKLGINIDINSLLLNCMSDIQFNFNHHCSALIMYPLKIIADGGIALKSTQNFFNSISMANQITFRNVVCKYFERFSTIQKLKNEHIIDPNTIWKFSNISKHIWSYPFTQLFDKSKIHNNLLSTSKVFRDMEFNTLGYYLLYITQTDAFYNILDLPSLPLLLFWRGVARYWLTTTVPHQEELCENELDIPVSVRSNIREMSTYVSTEIKMNILYVIYRAIHATRMLELTVEHEKETEFKNETAHWIPYNDLKLEKKPSKMKYLQRLIELPETFQNKIEGPLEVELQNLCQTISANPIHFRKNNPTVNYEKIDMTDDNKIQEILSTNVVVESDNNCNNEEQNKNVDEKQNDSDDWNKGLELAIKKIQFAMKIEKRELRSRIFPIKSCPMPILLLVAVCMAHEINPFFSRVNLELYDNAISLTRGLNYENHFLSMVNNKSYFGDYVKKVNANLGISDVTKLTEDLVDNLLELNLDKFPVLYRETDAYPNTNYLEVDIINYVNKNKNYTVEDIKKFVYNSINVYNPNLTVAETVDEELRNKCAVFVESLKNANEKLIKENCIYYIYVLLMDIGALNPQLYCKLSKKWREEKRIKRAKFYDDLLLRLNQK